MNGIARVLRAKVAALSLTAFAVPAHAQMDVAEGEWESDPVGEYYGDAAPHSEQPRTGPASLEEARASGGGLRLGGGSLQPRSVPDVYTVRRGDTLWDITGHFYGNPWQWPRVWSYNPEVTNPHWIYPDDRLRLVPEGSAAIRLAGGGPTVRVNRRPVERGSVLLRDQGYLDREALRASGEIVGSPADHMLLTVYDDVYIRFDEDQGVEPGMELTVFRRMPAGERGEGEEGELVRIFGTVRLRSYDREEKLGRGQITEALDPIERGFPVANVARRFDVVDPVTATADVEAEVVASLRPLQLFGEDQVVFVNAGEQQGVRLGNRFFIVRASDEWRRSLTTRERTAGASISSDRPDEYPDEILAEGRVVNVRPESAALFITRSVAEIELGDRAEMRRDY